MKYPGDQCKAIWVNLGLLHLLMVLSLVLGVHCAQGQNSFSLKSFNASVLGTSTLHEWESQITKLEFIGSLQLTGNELSTISPVEIKIPVESIKSKEGRKMDKKTYEAFESDKNPFIIYKLMIAKIEINTIQAAAIQATGKLTIAGTTLPAALVAKGKLMANGDLSLSVSKKIRMTEYSMKPPTMMLGTIRVGDEVTIKFDLILGPAN